jgi:hypothetical protein
MQGRTPRHAEEDLCVHLNVPYDALRIGYGNADPHVLVTEMFNP